MMRIMLVLAGIGLMTVGFGVSWIFGRIVDCRFPKVEALNWLVGVPSLALIVSGACFIFEGLTASGVHQR